MSNSRDPRCGRSNFPTCLINRLSSDGSFGEQELARCLVCEATADQLEEDVRSVGRQLAAKLDSRIYPSLPLFQDKAMPSRHPEPSETDRLSPQLGEYLLREVLSETKYGIAYRATHKRLKKDVALEWLNEDWSRDSHASFQLNERMRLIGKLEHPYLATVMDAGEADGNRYLVTQWIQGVDLESVVRLLGSLPVADACEIVREVAIAMSFSHKRGLIHGDLRPRKVMLDFDARPEPIAKVIGLGLSQTFLVSLHSNPMTQTNELRPIEITGPDAFEAVSLPSDADDVSALGAILWYLLTGESKPDPSWTGQLISRGEDRITVEEKGVPDDLVILVVRMLSQEPEAGLSSMLEVVDALAIHASGHDLSIVSQRVQTKCADERLRLVEPIAAALPSSSNVAFKPILRSPQAGEPSSIVNQAKFVSNPGKVESQSQSGSGRVFVWLGLLSLAGMIVGATLLWFISDGGYVTIRADSTVDASFELFRKGKQIDSIHVTPLLTNVPMWYRSGQYELRLSTDVEDRFEVEGGRFSLVRNQNHLIVIRKRDP